MGKETVVVIGSGGAESALVDKYSRSEEVGHIIAIPGNDTMQDLTHKPVTTYQDLKPDQTVEIALLVSDLNEQSPIAFVDIRDESAIASGLSNQLALHKVAVVSPSQKAGQIESDKYFARVFGEYINFPQPKYQVLDFTNLPYGKKFPDYYDRVIEKVSDGLKFVKASGLAQGKGVIGANGREEIEQAVEQLRRNFPQASGKILIEDGMVGEEFSGFAMSNGKSYKVIGYAQDHKRAYDGDKGPNTGGMGAVSRPLIIENDDWLQITVNKEIFGRTFEGMKESGIPYKGVLFLGGMAVEKLGVNVPHVVEFNSRWGDPEAQVLLPGIENDLFEMNSRIIRGNFRDYEVRTDNKVRVAVAGASKGYPEDYSHVTGKEIKGLDAVGDMDGVLLYGAGVVRLDGKYYANGGRLFYVVGEGDDVIEARGRVYEAMNYISIDGDNLHFRTDIGWRDVERLQARA